jgi:hypothetical protein
MHRIALTTGSISVPFRSTSDRSRFHPDRSRFHPDRSRFRSPIDFRFHSRSISDFTPGRSRILSNHVPELVIVGDAVDIGVLCQVLLRSKPTLLQTRIRLVTAGELVPGTLSGLADQEAWNHVTLTQMPATRCSTFSSASRSQVRKATPWPRGWNTVMSRLLACRWGCRGTGRMPDRA